MKKYIWAIAALIVVGIVFSDDVLQQRLNQLEVAVNNKFISIETRLSQLQQKVDTIQPEQYSPPSNTPIFIAFFALIAFLFIMNVTTLIQIHSLKQMTPKQAVAAKSTQLENLKKYIDYCKFQKGMKIIDIKEELLKKGWTDDQIDEALK